MSIRVGINGFGRIGRNIYRAAHELNPDVEIVAVNDLGDSNTFAHLLKHDTALGTFGPRVEAAGEEIKVNGRSVKFLSVKDPGELPWRDLDVDVVVESTGLFTDANKARVHIDRGGAKKVIISAPATNQDYTVVMGVNHRGYEPASHNVISNGSCTTNCFVPLAKVLNDGISSSFRAALIAGLIAATVSGFVAVWGLLKLVRTHSFTPFVIYRVTAGIVVLILAATVLN